MSLEQFDADFTPTAVAEPPRPTGRTPTPQQQALYDAVRDGMTHIAVESVAGSGKTTSAVGAAAVASGKVGMTAFNKHIAAELQSRLAGSAKACTMHSLGFAAVRRAFPGCVTDEKKPDRLLEKLRPDWLRERNGRRFWSDRGKATLGLARLAKLTLADCSDGGLDALAGYYGVDLPDGADGVYDAIRALLSRELEVTSVIDFDDMVWLPVCLDLPVEQFDVLMVDEAQDLNRAQHALCFAAARSGRLIPIGDRSQCQPAGTLVTLTGGSRKPIEAVRPGDQVVSFDRSSSAMVGRLRSGPRVAEVASRPYAGPMLTVRAAGCQTCCTPEHRWVARFVSRDTGLWVTYLMRRGQWFRVGWCQLFDAVGGLHLGARARNERAEQAWILSVHRDKTEASIAESVIATRFGLPLLPFEPVNGAQHITRESIGAFFAAMDSEGFLPARVETCLKSFGRSIEYPFYRNDYQQRQGRTTIFETQACNLISGVMSIPVYTGNVSPLWSEITACVAEAFEGTVYSLKVSDHETYVADGLVTHNSIYGFTGSDPDSLPNLVSTLSGSARGCADRPLTVTFRCPQAHVALAQKLVPQIEAAPGAADGVVDEVEPSELTGQVQPGDLVICRANAPLVGEAFRLIARDISAIMLGRDFGKGLIDLIDRLKPSGCNDLIKKTRDWLDREVERLERKDASESQIQSVADRAECLIELASHGGTVQSIRDRIISLFAEGRDPAKVVTLASVHRAKGSEADRVFIVAPEKMPLIFSGKCRNCGGGGISPFGHGENICRACGGTGKGKRRASRSWEIQQEMNILYIAVTRAKRELYFAGPMPSPLR